MLNLQAPSLEGSDGKGEGEKIRKEASILHENRKYRRWKGQEKRIHPQLQSIIEGVDEANPEEGMGH